MTRYLDPTNDVAFKKLFGTENHKSLLISFLNAILGLENKRRIKSVELLPQEEAPQIKGLKTSILDIKCTDERNVQYIVEMQNRKIPSFIKRTQYYLAHSYVNQLSKGSTHLELRPIILLAIANHELFPEKDRVISFHKTLDTKTFENDLKDMSYVFVELPKFTKSETELKTVQDKWIYFLKNWHESKSVPPTVSEEEIIEAYNTLEQFNWNAFEKEAYLKATIANDEEHAIKLAEFEKGRKEGREKGLQEGIEQGIQKGIQKGIEQGKRQAEFELIQKMLEAGATHEDVVKLTGLSMAELPTPRNEPVKGIDQPSWQDIKTSRNYPPHQPKNAQNRFRAIVAFAIGFH